MQRLTPVSDLTGPWHAHPSDLDLAKQFLEPAFDDGGWADVQLPHHWQSTAEFAGHDGPLLYRRHFTRAPVASGQRTLLELDGIFYYGDVWLDGNYVGATEGYFSPTAFDVTEQLASGGDHVLAIEVACPPQRDRTAKRAITGDFGHSVLLDPAFNPGGIWRPVRVATTGPLTFSRVRVVCVEATEERGRLLVDVTIDAGEQPAPGACLRVEIDDPAGGELARHTQELTLAAGENRIRTNVDVEHAPRWWPRRLGEQPLCSVRITLDDGDGRMSDGRALSTAFREIRARGFPFHRER